MKAVQFVGKGKVKLIEREKPVSRDDVVVVKVTSSGICGTDVELLLPSDEPLDKIGGHEVTGIVAEVDNATKYKVGDRVMVNCHVTCGVCERCRNGDVIFCSELKAIGFELDGGNAEYVAVPEASLRALPDDISEEAGVIIGDALGTPYHAVKKSGIQPGEFVGIFGVGPLGLMGVISAKHFRARVVAIDINEQRLDAARNFGADYTVNPKEGDAYRKIISITGGKGIDRSIECAGSPATIHLSLNTLRLRGKHVQVGVCIKVELNPFEQINNREIEIVGSRNFNNNELGEIIEFVRKYPQIEEIVTHRFPLEEAEKAFEVAKKGEGIKILLKP